VLADLGTEFDRQRIALVSLSTTLATNALVEGQGAQVAVILIGFDDEMAARTQLTSALPDAPVIRIAGGHDHGGEEVCPLDTAALETALEAIQSRVQSYAVAAQYSVRNPDHERRAQQLIQKRTGCPVTASCDLCDALDGPRRALTAAFNTRIITLIMALIEAVQIVLHKNEIDAPLMIVKGDGSITTAKDIIDSPIETILSGPAASVIGARFISELADFIIADIGGTTTDVAIVRNGWPALNERGSKVGGYRTLVSAIDMQTIGLGGDSEVVVDYRGHISLQANRVVPISLLASRWPSTLVRMNADASGTGRGAARFILRPDGHAQDTIATELSDADKQFLDSIGPEPRAWSDVVLRITDLKRVQRLTGRGLLQIAGLTPSDAAHVLDLQSQWSKPAAELACLLSGRDCGLIPANAHSALTDCRQFAQGIFDAVAAASAHIIIERLTGRSFDPRDPLISAVTRGADSLGDLHISLTPKLPLVAVGGPAQVFYPAVGKHLGSQVHIPPGCEVANAIGAAVGMFKTTAVVEITHREEAGYHLHGEQAPVICFEPGEVLSRAQQLARRIAQDKSLAMGGQDLMTEIKIERVDIPDMPGDSGLVSATITAQCLSTPGIGT